VILCAFLKNQGEKILGQGKESHLLFPHCFCGGSFIAGGNICGGLSPRAFCRIYFVSLLHLALGFGPAASYLAAKAAGRFLLYFTAAAGGSAAFADEPRRRAEHEHGQ